MTIYLIRHGKTEANEKRLYCGRSISHIRFRFHLVEKKTIYSITAAVVIEFFDINCKHIVGISMCLAIIYVAFSPLSRYQPFWPLNSFY